MPTLGFAVPALGSLSLQHLPFSLICSSSSAVPLLPLLMQAWI